MALRNRWGGLSRTKFVPASEGSFLWLLLPILSPEQLDFFENQFRPLSSTVLKRIRLPLYR
jgi:hypothetical protein